MTKTNYGVERKFDLVIKDKTKVDLIEEHIKLAEDLECVK